MTTVILFTSGHHTKPVIEVLKRDKNIQLVGIYKKLPEKSKKADVFIVADFGQIIPKKILELPQYGTLCLHPSLLPKYRGPSPVQQAIIDGQKETGVTIFKMDEQVDHGPIIAQFKEEIRDDDTAETLYKRLFVAGAEVLVTTLPAWVEGRIKTREQDHSRATSTKKLTRQDGRINWNWPDAKIERFIRAMTPWPGAWSKVAKGSRGDVGRGIGDEAEKRALKGATTIRLKILKAHLEPSLPDRRHVTIPDRKSVLVPDQVQLPGKKPISWKQFLAGHKDWQLI